MKKKKGNKNRILLFFFNAVSLFRARKQQNRFLTPFSVSERRLPAVVSRPPIVRHRLLQRQPTFVAANRRRARLAPQLRNRQTMHLSRENDERSRLGSRQGRRRPRNRSRNRLFLPLL